MPITEQLAALAEVEVQGHLKLTEATDLGRLKEIESSLTGKRSDLARMSQTLGALPDDERKELGRVVGEVRSRLNESLAARKAALGEAERVRRLEAEAMDLTEVLPQVGHGHLNLISQTRQALEDVFVGMGYVVAEGPEVETDWYNFEALNIPPAHPARSMWDTFYLDLGEPESLLLRTHTSPVQIRLMETQEPPIYAVMPGRCHRRETPDARHTATFHQVEGLVVDSDTNFGDLAGTIEAFTGAYFGPDIHSRLRPAYFPFTEPSAEFEITCAICLGQGCRTCSGTGWIELGGCGLVDPAVFAAVGIDDEKWSGFAFGFGIDRCAQMRHGLADMRVVADNDVRLLSQF